MTGRLGEGGAALVDDDGAGAGAGAAASGNLSEAERKSYAEGDKAAIESWIVASRFGAR